MSKSTDQKNNISVGWVSPSNIALVKYWGKHSRQLPRNASVSFTLSHARTTTYVTLESKIDPAQESIQFTFEGKSNPAFSQRIEKFLASITDEYFPLLKDKKLIIDTQNTFPHSSGIASSASGMSALALCLCDLEQQYTGKTSYDDAFYNKASIVARLGSGSAARSLFPYASVWGHHRDLPDSSDEYGISAEELIHPIFKSFHDDILIVSDQEKSVSSTVGHQLMDNNPYAPARYQQAEHNFSLLIQALKEGDLTTFGNITEDEALTLHALMMCSNPSFILMSPSSLEVINKIRTYRKNTGIPVYFTLDAGPNVHVLYPHEYVSQVSQFISDELKTHCQNGRIVHDQVGNGPHKVT